VRQWVLSLPIPLRVLLAAQPELVTPVLQVVQRVVGRHLLDSAQLKADEGHGGVITLIQRFGSAANLNIHFHGLLLDGVYRCGADGVPQFVEVGSPTDDEVHALLQRNATPVRRLRDRLAMAPWIMDTACIDSCPGCRGTSTAVPSSKLPSVILCCNIRSCRSSRRCGRVAFAACEPG
jgi:hypothetical protein